MTRDVEQRYPFSDRNSDVMCRYWRPGDGALVRQKHNVSMPLLSSEGSHDQVV